MESNINKKKESKTITDSILMTLAVILLLKNAIDLFFFDLFPPVADNVFWVLISVIFTITFYIKKSYICLVVVLVILLVGIFNF
ncbi:hypothetical protein [Aquibacillus rhizosphaerae]|uniref:Uncharacterized protein n=1 Tax=Aquibacillus rhizosphaerae TaxID=3051431 RepID=A0ABT7L382_9BACI|nr:hypothetical protein [Aquibacillus sp. LR5S19]MDL4840333.1 hypothetical protein [Aquibacillus sp. LR5S19]